MIGFLAFSNVAVNQKLHCQFSYQTYNRIFISVSYQFQLLGLLYGILDYKGSKYFIRWLNGSTELRIIVLMGKKKCI